MKTCESKENHEEPMLAALIKEMNERLVKSLLDVIVLVKLRDGATSLGGYDVMDLVHQEYDILMSSGTIYAVLYSMERSGLIEGKDTARKRAYMLTKKGENKIKGIMEVKTSIIDSLAKIVM